MKTRCSDVKAFVICVWQLGLKQGNCGGINTFENLFLKTCVHRSIHIITSEGIFYLLFFFFEKCALCVCLKYRGRERKREEERGREKEIERDIERQRQRVCPPFFLFQIVHTCVWVCVCVCVCVKRERERKRKSVF